LEKNIPKISIITVSLNAVNSIEATLRSVINQSYPSLEHIVVDGGSEDGTLELLRSYNATNGLIFISEPDSGIYDAMNKGIALATGEWVFFLGSDDVFLDDGIIDKIFNGNSSDAEIVYGNVKYLHSGKIYDGPFDHEKISQKNICHQSIFFNYNVFERLGNFNLKYKIYADFEFNLRWMGANTKSLYIDETIVLYNEKGISGHIIDTLFVDDFDDLLIENNIISTRSFYKLKLKHQMILNSNRFKIANTIFTPIARVKNKIF
jgi:glycosyltransferase involved in cell wall biosynthesis